MKVDDHTVDFILATPNPILHYEWETWLIFSKSWAEANGAVHAQPASATALSPGALKANGTGPFMIASHEPGVQDRLQAQSELVGHDPAQPRTRWCSRPSRRTRPASPPCCRATSI